MARYLSLVRAKPIEMTCSSRVLSQVAYRGGYSGGVPPLPIPNREVKPARADGTAPPGGRVGRRRPSGSPSEKQETADPAGSLLFTLFRLKILVEDPVGFSCAGLQIQPLSHRICNPATSLQICKLAQLTRKSPPLASSVSGSKNHRTALYCRQTDIAAAGMSAGRNVTCSVIDGSTNRDSRNRYYQ